MTSSPVILDLTSIPSGGAPAGVLRGQRPSRAASTVDLPVDLVACGSSAAGGGSTSRPPPGGRRRLRLHPATRPSDSPGGRSRRPRPSDSPSRAERPWRCVRVGLEPRPKDEHHAQEGESEGRGRRDRPGESEGRVDTSGISECGGASTSPSAALMMVLSATSSSVT